MYYFGTRITQQNLGTDLVVENGEPVRIFEIYITNTSGADITMTAQGQDSDGNVIFTKKFWVSGEVGGDAYIQTPFIADNGFKLTALGSANANLIQATVMHTSPGS